MCNADYSSNMFSVPQIEEEEELEWNKLLQTGIFWKYQTVYLQNSF